MKGSDLPDDSAEYYNKDTGDLMRYMYRDDEEFHFSVNGGERTFSAPVGWWLENWEEHWIKQ